ncbi:MAG: SDR family oxidoreductase [Xanthomonadales bacterium]|nr:SDR family oxidoreductase [Xanthomonadales bacterium]
MSVVIITGSNNGFGYEGALAFARNGDTVYASMRDVNKADRLLTAAKSENLNIHIKALDVTRPETFAAFLQQVVDEAGRIDVLVNNAGIVYPGSLEDVPESGLRKVMETNFFGPLLLTRAVLPFMRAQGKGMIIMMSSLSGIAGLPGDLPYSASKFALEGATECLRHEVDRFGIKVALVEAGMYATSIFDSALADDAELPADYPQDSPYRPLVESKLREVRNSLSKAFHPKIVADVFVQIAQSDGSQLRWQADEVAVHVVAAMFGHDDKGRDDFLRMASGTDWWSEGKNHAE